LSRPEWLFRGIRVWPSDIEESSRRTRKVRIKSRCRLFESTVRRTIAARSTIGKRGGDADFGAMCDWRMAPRLLRNGADRNSRESRYEEAPGRSSAVIAFRRYNCK